MRLLSWFTGRQNNDDFGLAERDRLRRYIADIEEELSAGQFETFGAYRALIKTQYLLESPDEADWCCEILERVDVRLH